MNYILLICSIVLLLGSLYYISTLKNSEGDTVLQQVQGIKAVCPPPVTDADYIVPEDSPEVCNAQNDSNIESFYFSTKTGTLRSNFPTKTRAKYGGTDSCPTYTPPPTTKTVNCDPALDYCRGSWKDQNFTYIPRQDIGGYDIACYQDNRNPDDCRDRCLADPNCKGYNSVGGIGWNGCCYKTVNGPLVKSNFVDFYSKNTSAVTSGDDCYSKLNPKTVNLPKARYLKITLNNPGDPWLNLTEVQAFDENGIKINGTPSMSSIMSPFVPTNCTDGNLTNFCHANGNKNDWFQLDFGSEKFVSRIIVYNRQDCCQQRLKGSYIQLINNANVTVWIRSIYYIQPIYYFNLVKDGKLSVNPTGWASVKNRKSGESDADWGMRIYDAIVNDPVGSRPFGGGIEQGIWSLISDARLAGKSVLDLAGANGACGNPTYWYYNYSSLPEQRTKFNGAAMCNPANSQAINFA